MAKEDALEFIIEARLKKDKFIKECKQVANLSGKFGKIIEENLTAGKDLPKHIHKSEDGKSAFALAKVGKHIHKLSYRIDRENKVALKNQGRVSKKDLAKYFNYDLPQMELKASSLEAKWQRDKEAQKLAKEEERANKQAKKPMSWAQKFWNSFKRIGFYRLIRGFFASLKNTFVQGTQTLAMFDKEANKSLSSIITSVDKLKASIVVSFMPVLDIIAPAFEGIANTIVDVANEISRASSASKGLSEYTAVSDEYMKDYANTVNKVLTGFDKFETLNGSSSNPLVSKEMTKEEMAEAKASSANNILNSIKSVADIVWDTIRMIAGTIADVWSSLEPHADKITRLVEVILSISSTLIKFITDVVLGITGTLDELGLLEVALWGIVAVWASIKVLKIADWFIDVGKKINNSSESLKKFSSMLKKTAETSKLANGAIGAGGLILSFTLFSKLLEKLEGPMKTFVTIGIMVAGTILAIKSAISGNWLGLGIGVGAILAGITSLANIQLFANGGVPDKGSLFVAGEAGAELVHTMPSGQTGVTNISQFKQAMVEALYEASDVFQQAESSLELSLDGAVIARSKRFKSELNRTNPKLNLK